MYIYGLVSYVYFLSIPLTARLISISSKSLWSSMAATSQRYSAVSDRVVLKIRMLAGSLSWALFSKSPFQRGGERVRERKKRLYNCTFKHTTWLYGSRTEFGAKFLKGTIHSAELCLLRHCFEILYSTACWVFHEKRKKKKTFQEVYPISCFESRHNWGRRF